MTAAKVPTVVEALSAVMADVGAVAKRQRNEQQNFNFRGIDAVVDACSPALRKHGVVVTPRVQSIERGTVEVGRNRTPMGHVAVLVAYTFHGPAGDHIDVLVPGESMDSGDKATAKAMSVAFRTALLQALALPTHDPDPDSQTYERSPAPEPDPHAVRRGELLEEIRRLAELTGIPTAEVAARFTAKHQTDIRVATPAQLEPVVAELQARVEAMTEDPPTEGETA